MFKNCYNNIISLGFSCATAFAIKHFFEENFTSGIFNWVYVVNKNSVIDVLKNPDLLFSEGIEPVPNVEMFECKNTHLRFHTTYDHNLVFSNHLLKKEYEEMVYKELRSRNIHLLSKVLNAIKSKEKNLFVLEIEPKEENKDWLKYLTNLESFLLEISGNKNFKIICVVRKDYKKYYDKNLDKLSKTIICYVDNFTQPETRNLINENDYAAIFKHISTFKKKDNHFFEQIFSIKNSSDKMHKILTVFGIKFKFKKKNSNLILFNENTTKLRNDIIDMQNNISTLRNNIIDTQNNISILQNDILSMRENLKKFDECTGFLSEILWKCNAINRNVNNIFQYNTGIELNNNFIMEREILFDPKRAPIDHYNRYAFAVENITESDVVADIACTCGYGSSMLAKKAQKVIGVDINQPVINFANKIFKTDNSEFYCQDAQELTLTEELDVVVSFETIEHIPHPELFLKKINSLLKANGKLICSVPNETTRPWAKEGNEFHYRHYTKDELAELLNNCGFYIEEIYEQYQEDNYQIAKKDYEGQMIIAIARKQ